MSRVEWGILNILLCTVQQCITSGRASAVDTVGAGKEKRRWGKIEAEEEVRYVRIGLICARRYRFSVQFRARHCSTSEERFVFVKVQDAV